jgi:hypothetical protein
LGGRWLLLVIFDQVCGLCLPFDVRLAPKPTELRRSSEMARWATTGLTRRTKAAARRLPVNDLIGLVSDVGGTILRRANQAPRYGLYHRARRRGARRAETKFARRLAIDQRRIYRAEPRTTLSSCKTVSLGMSTPVMAFGGCRSPSRTSSCSRLGRKRAMMAQPQLTKKQASILSSTSVVGEGNTFRKAPF